MLTARHVLPAAACALWLMACTPLSGTLPAGSAAVEFSEGDAGLLLRRGGDVLLRLPAAAFQIATVPAFDDTISYDPYWIEYAGDVLPVSPPDDLRWHT